jgi:hypothetical protein
MFTAAKINLNRSTAYRELIRAGPHLKDKGDLLIDCLCRIRIRKRDWETGMVLDHLESRLKTWQEEGIQDEDFPRLAIYRVLAREVGIGEGRVQKNDELGKRWKVLGDEYEKLAESITPEERWMQYAENFEDKFRALAREIYPDLT